MSWTAIVYSAPAAAANVSTGSFPSVSTASATRTFFPSNTSIAPLKFDPNRRAVRSHVIGPATAALNRYRSISSFFQSRPFTVTGKVGNTCGALRFSSSRSSVPLPTMNTPAEVMPFALAACQRIGPGGRSAGRTNLAERSRSSGVADNRPFAPNQYGGGGMSKSPSGPTTSNFTRGS